MTLVRTALATDAARIDDLLGQLGYTTGPALVQQKLAAFAVSPMDAVLVAEGDDHVVGVASLHVLAEGGDIVFPYEAIKVQFVLQAV
jgi:hypothetical protein